MTSALPIPSGQEPVSAGEAPDSGHTCSESHTQSGPYFLTVLICRPTPDRK